MAPTQSVCMQGHLHQHTIRTWHSKTHGEKDESKMYACAHPGQAHTHAHKSAQIMGTETNHGNRDLTGSLLPSHQSGHLINVTQHPILLHCVFLHSAPASRPEACSHCKLLFSGKLSKALIGERGEKPLPELPISSPTSLPPFSLVLYSHHYTQIML